MGKSGSHIDLGAIPQQFQDDLVSYFNSASSD